MGACGSATIGPVVKSNNINDIYQEFQFKKKLGAGGSCEVSLVERDGEQYALKSMDKSSTQNRELFEQEVTILSALDHNYIVKYIDCYEDKKSFHIVTELCQGGELFDRIVAHHHFSEEIASRLVRTMLEALQHCHTHQVVHRDLKPENFVYDTMEDDSDLKLIDFGCALIVQNDKRYTDLVGTPYYLAPESANARAYRDGNILKASDLWSIGVITFVIVTGRPPFYGNSNMEIFKAVLKGKVKFGGAKVSDSVKNFIMSLLQPKPDNRPTASQALKHPWVKGKTATSEKLNNEVIENLKNFNHQCKLKKAIARLVVSQMTEKDLETLHEQFNRLDENGDGELQMSEIATMLAGMGYNAEDAEKEAKEIMDDVDLDHDGAISFGEFSEATIRKKLSIDMESIRNTFSAMDRDGDGFLDTEEMQEMFGTTLDEQAVAEMIKEVDKNKDGKISFDEFVNAMKEQMSVRAETTLMEKSKIRKQKRKMYEKAGGKKRAKIPTAMEHEVVEMDLIEKDLKDKEKRKESKRKKSKGKGSQRKDSRRKDKKKKDGESDKDTDAGGNKDDAGAKSERDKPIGEESRDEPDEESRDEPDEESRDEPDEGSRDEPDEGSHDEPDEGSHDEPDEGSHDEPDEGSYDEPGAESRDKPAVDKSEDVSKPDE